MRFARLQYPARILAVAAVFILAGKLSLLLAFARSVAPLWLPAGVSLAAVLLFGPRIWPGVALGALVTNLTTGSPLLFCLAATLGNTLEALLGGWLLRRRAGFDPRLGRQSDVVALATFVAFGSTALNATIGVTMLCATGAAPWSSFFSAWTVWWLGDAMGVLIGTPMLLTRFGPPGPGRGMRRMEGLALIVVGLLGGAIVFSDTLTRLWGGAPVVFLLFPVVIWGALRFGPRGGATVALTVAVMAIWGTAHGHGPFAQGDWFVSARYLQGYIGTLGVSALLLAALTAEREQSGAALAESEARQRFVLDSLKEVVFQADRAGNWLFLNPAWAELTGFGIAESLGTNCLDHVHPEDRAATLELYQALADGRSETERRELRVLTRDGGTLWVELHARRLLDAEGEMRGTSGTLSDITARHEAEVERRRLEEQLLQAQKMESIGRLAGGVAHDFNNILTAVIGYTELLASQLPGQDERSELVAEIRKAADRAASLTRQLLTFSRRQVVEFMLFDPNENLRDLAEMLHRVLGEDVELKLELDPEAGPIQADPGQFSQIILNLAVNARDAMPHGGRLTIQTGRFCPEASAGNNRLPGREDRVAIAMTDTGAGMSPEILAHIFEPFYTTKEPGKGTGLGLSTVYGIVQQSEGEIEVTSAPGRGTTFRIHLPRREQAPALSPEPPPREPAEPRTEVILLVEDDDAVRHIAAQALTARGHRVHAMRSAEQAIDLVERGEVVPNLLVTDVVLPGQSGVELAEALDRRAPGLPVLFVSGYDFDMITPDRVLPEGRHYLQKPFTPGTLVAKVRQALEAAQAGSRAGR